MTAYCVHHWETKDDTRVVNADSEENAIRCVLLTILETHAEIEETIERGEWEAYKITKPIPLPTMFLAHICGEDYNDYRVIVAKDPTEARKKLLEAIQTLEKKDNVDPYDMTAGVSNWELDVLAIESPYTPNLIV